ncbi:MAG TPA: GreA/GreB family elongation factor [Caulobacteraceae bacterium]
MSRAFVKEADDAPPAPPLERPVSGAPNLVTPRGARLIEERVAALEAQLSGAKDDAAVALLRRDLRYWVTRHASMKVVPAVPVPAGVGFGLRATIRRGAAVSEMVIVGEDEADPAAGLISWTAPLARALDGAVAGEDVEFQAGGKTERIDVLAVKAR